MTRFAFAVLMALCTAGPVALRSFQLFRTSAMAPDIAPASAAFCVWLRAVMNMPTSIASVVADMKAMKPMPMYTNDMPRSSR